MTELFETFSKDCEPTGLVDRSLVHKQGLWHRASNVFLFRTDGRLVVQRRHESKDVWPGVWDLSVAEHLQPGENYIAAAIRGLKEELGIESTLLQPMGKVVRTRIVVAEDGIKDYEFQMCFRGVSAAKLKARPSEVSETDLIELDDLKTAMHNSPDRFTPWFRQLAHETHYFDEYRYRSTHI